MAPAHGAVAGGTRVLVRGVNFVASPGAACLFGDARVPAAVLDNETVACRTPPGDEGGG